MEVAFRFALRPLFLRLLASNPSAGTPAKRKRTATQMLPRAVCFVHNVLQVPLALAILLDPPFRRDPMFYSTPFSRLVMLVSAGYFAYDTLECIWRFEHEGPEFLLHGVMCFVTYSQLYRSRQMNWLGVEFFCFSVVFVFVCSSERLFSFSSLIFFCVVVPSSLGPISWGEEGLGSARCPVRATHM